MRSKSRAISSSNGSGKNICPELVQSKRNVRCRLYRPHHSIERNRFADSSSRTSQEVCPRAALIFDRGRKKQLCAPHKTVSPPIQSSCYFHRRNLRQPYSPRLLDGRLHRLSFTKPRSFRSCHCGSSRQRRSSDRFQKWGHARNYPS